MAKTVYILDENAAAMVNSICSDLNSIKSGICDAFSNVVLYSDNFSEAWKVLSVLQDYVALVDALSKVREDKSEDGGQ